MSRSILDQNFIKFLNFQNNFDEIIISPMFMWEFFNNINHQRESTLIQNFKRISNRIVVPFKSTTCQALEIKSGRISSFDMIIDHQNTEIIKEWLNKEKPSINEIKDKLAFGFTSTAFMDKFNHLAKSALSIIKKKSKNFQNHKNKESYRYAFETEDESVSRDLCFESIKVGITILENKGYSQERAIQFLHQPSIIYNQAFIFLSTCWYRAATQSLDQNQASTFKIIANDFKDNDLLFCAPYAQYLLTEDSLMKSTFLHLKKSYEILGKMTTGLD